MIMIDKLDNAFRFQQEALNLRSQRQTVLASNIANADTPGYKARDIDFKSALQSVVEKGRPENGGLTLATTASGHINANAPALDSSDWVKYRQSTQASFDNNTVDLDVERVQFADNTVQYQAGLQILGDQVKKMLAAIQQG
jgi:flagellar basal-body rod protein FlgB